jgi:GNAT superfamily N-acetyltransferase
MDPFVSSPHSHPIDIHGQSTSMDIRPFERRDAAAVIDLVLGIQNDEFHLGLSICDQRDLEDIEAYYLKGGGTFFVAEEPAGRIVGSIGLLRLRDDLGVMKKFFVAAGHRGREHGVARALYDRFIAFAQREGIRQIVLGAAPFEQLGAAGAARLDHLGTRENAVAVGIDQAERLCNVIEL